MSSFMAMTVTLTVYRGPIVRQETSVIPAYARVPDELSPLVS